MNAVAPTYPKRSIMNPRGEGEEPEGGTGDAITQFAPLGELVSLISSGSTPLGGASNYSAAGEVMLIRSQNVHMRQLVLDDVAFVSRRTADVMARTYLARGDVLLNITGASIGRSALFDLHTTANVNQHVCVIRPKPDCLDARYLVSFLASPAMQRRIMSQQNGGTRQALTFSQIAAFEVPLRPLPEQRRIADILDKADAIRRKRKETVALTEELLRSTFLDMFGDPVTNPKGWEVKSLGDLLSNIDSGWSPVCEARQASEAEWGVLKLGAVTFGRYDENEHKALGSGTSPLVELEVRPCDVLFRAKHVRARCGMRIRIRDSSKVDAT